jgi:cytidylate kinase
MATISMSQEMGSLGKDVAFQVAEALGLTLVRDQMISDLVADKMHKPKSSIRRYREGRASLLERMETSRKTLAIYSAEEVYEYATKGNVLIRGWGATYLLRSVPHVLRVRVCAPFEKRVQWLMERLNTDDYTLVREEIRRSDATRLANINYWFLETKGNPLDYDLVLNTERISIESCVDLIKLTVSRPEFQQTEASQRQLINLALESKVHLALKSNPGTEDIEISVEADNAKIILTGIVTNGKEREACENTVANVSGVREVDNRLKIIRGTKSFR